MKSFDFEYLTLVLYFVKSNDHVSINQCQAIFVTIL